MTAAKKWWTEIVSQWSDDMRSAARNIITNDGSISLQDGLERMDNDPLLREDKENEIGHLVLRCHD
ncbi:hypothetical protein AGMMS49573_07900 [Endomicrobiia bacterium]|nr:hypothetical protein AGMMS49573_07900 [Endomicrobiia bacterium]